MKQTFLAALGQVGSRIQSNVRYDVDESGRVVRAGTCTELRSEPMAPAVRDWGHALVLPGFVNGHSHAFQRGIRGITQRRTGGETLNFWSWRTAMYEAANRLDPGGVYAVTKRAYEEMLRAGFTTVGEFHYVHHQPDGTPYDDSNELSWQIVRAAEDVGIGLVLLEVFYERAGAGAGPAPEQRRFCDGTVESFLGRVDRLRARGVNVGIAPHSVRAVSSPALRELVAYAEHHGLPLHIHVSEQPRENAECVAEHGCTPTALLESVGALGTKGRLTAVHGVFLAEQDKELLRGQTVCACPTTEADLGDGIVPAGDLVRSEVSLCVGSDSNAVIDPVQELRLLEMGERLRTGSRLCMAHGDLEVAEQLIRAGTYNGARSLGVSDSVGQLQPGLQFDAVVIDAGHPYFGGVPSDAICEALVLGGTSSLVRQVVVAGRERA